jgi:flagellar biosynthesis chaperone FliJ
MRRMIIGLAALLVITSGATAQEKQMTEQQRRELEQKLDHLRQEMRELERQLGRARGRWCSWRRGRRTRRWP